MQDDLGRDLGRLEGKVDALSDTASRIEKHIADQGDRIAILEQRQWYTAGAAAAIAWFAATFVDLRAAFAKFIG